MKNLNLWRKAEVPDKSVQPQINFKCIKQVSNGMQHRVAKNKIPVFKEINKFKTKFNDPKITENKLKEANKLQLVDSVEGDKENVSGNIRSIKDIEMTFKQLDGPILNIQRK
jgi:hypothetical protein